MQAEGLRIVGAWTGPQLKCILPRTFVALQPLNGSSYFVSVCRIACPDHSKTGAAFSILNGDQVSATKQLRQAGQECTLPADVAGESRLRERQALGIDAPDDYRKVGLSARLSPAVNCHYGAFSMELLSTSLLSRGARVCDP